MMDVDELMAQIAKIGKTVKWALIGLVVGLCVILAYLILK